MIREGSEVTWKWGNGSVSGKVKSTYTKTVSRTIDGTEVTRNGEQNNKALYIEVENGNNVLKLESEVQKK